MIPVEETAAGNALPDGRDPALRRLLLAALFAAVVWTLRHTATHFSYDLEGHARYLTYLSEHPASLYGYRGPEEHHPPFFYLLAGIAASIARRLGAPLLVGPRLLSLVAFGAFLSFGLRTVALHVADRRARLVAGALLAFWPIGLVMASRVTNDVALMACAAAALFHLSRYRLHAAPDDYVRGWLWACAGLFVKSSGWVVWPLVWLAPLGVARRVSGRRFAWLVVVFVVAVAANNAGWWVKSFSSTAPVAGSAAAGRREGEGDSGALASAHDPGRPEWQRHFGGEGRQPLRLRDFVTFPAGELLRPSRPLERRGTWRYDIGLNHGVNLVSRALFGVQATSQSGRTKSRWYFGDAGRVLRVMLLVLLVTTLVVAFRLLRAGKGWLAAVGAGTLAVAFGVHRWAPEAFVPVEHGYGFRPLERTGPGWQTAWEPLLPVACLVAGALALRRLRREPVAAWLVIVVGCFVAFSAGFTAWKRFDECADFRFVYAVLVPLASLYGIAATDMASWPRRALLVLGGAFAVFSGSYVFLQFPL